MSLLNRLFGNSEKRTSQFQILANELNLNYSAETDSSIIKQLNDFTLFKNGHSKKITNILHSNELLDANYLFDYQYVISTGKTSHRFRQTVFFVNSKQLSLPQFIQKPETFFTNLLAFLGYQDIDFDQFPEYSEKFNLKGEFEEVIRFYFSEEVLGMLSRHKAFNMEGMNYYFIVYHQGQLVAETDLRAFRNLGMMLYQLFLLQSKKSDTFLF